jgi:hypothetical protein
LPDYEPPKPPRPEQISPEEADRFRLAHNLCFSGNMQKLIKAIEERTREIVAWEQEYEVKK